MSCYPSIAFVFYAMTKYFCERLELFSWSFSMGNNKFKIFVAICQAAICVGWWQVSIFLGYKRGRIFSRVIPNFILAVRAFLHGIKLLINTEGVIFLISNRIVRICQWALYKRNFCFTNSKPNFEQHIVFRVLRTTYGRKFITPRELCRKT